MKLALGRRGFSMIETVAILVIIGIIIGGLWVAYSSVNARNKHALYEKTMSDLLRITREYVGQYNEATNTNVVYHSVSGQRRIITSNLANADLLPPGVIAGTDPNTFEMDGIILGNIVTFPSKGNPYGTGPLVGIRLTRVRRDHCRAILSDWAGSPDRIQSSGLVAVSANNDVLTATDVHQYNLFDLLPDDEVSLRPADITAACSQTQNNVLMFLFRLNN